MSEMIERVAKAIYPSVIAQSESYNEVPIEEAFSRVRYSHLRATAMEAASAAIEALREPTTEMVREAYWEAPFHAKRAWQAMIDAARGNPPP